MDTAYIFMVIDGVIARLDMAYDIDKKHLKTLTPTIPYCDIVADYGNPIARAYRERDHSLERGTTGTDIEVPIKTFDVLVVDADHPPEFYLFKKYVDGKIVPNPDLTEEERLHKANQAMASSPLPFGFDNTSFLFWNGDQYADFKDYVTKEWFVHTVAHIRAQEPFSAKEKAEQLALVNKMPADLGNRMKYGFAMGEQMHALADFSVQSTEDIKRNPAEYVKGPRKGHTLHNKIAILEGAIAWFDMLRGTPLEKVALSRKAALYFVTHREHEAVHVYEDMLATCNLTPEERQAILTKIQYIGNGRHEFFDAQRFIKDGNYNDAIIKLEEFLRTATGETRLHLHPQVVDLLKKCKTILRRK